MLKFLKYTKIFFDFKNRKNCMEDIVFFSESNSYKPFLFPLIEDLLKNNFKLIYLTIDPEDSILLKPPPNLTAYYIPDGLFISITFAFLKAKILITTMPDLNKFYLKRSIYKVHYVYLQHSLFSTHMIYNEGAFDYFDTILCAGNHHIEEIREWEFINNLPKKNLYKHGYIPLDKIVEKKETFFKSNKLDKLNKSNKYISILLAPSWGQNGIIHHGAERLIKALLKEEYKITLRLHPQSYKTSKTQVKSLEEKFLKFENFFIDTDKTTYDIFYNTDVLITDWSGISLEFFFAFEKPIIFLDTQKKINNRRFRELKSIPVEIKIREKIGIIVNLKDIKNIKNSIEKVMKIKLSNHYIKKLREEYIFHFGTSIKEGTKIIKKIYDQL